jgi:hypothetical protein
LNSIVNQYTTELVNNKKDLEQCIELLTKSFSFADLGMLRESMSFFINNTPQLICIVVKKDSQVIALQCILNREINFFGVLFKVAGMSYAAIEKKFQNSEVGKILKTNLFDYINSNADLSVGFARKAMDNYWFPYGYRGVTNFGEIILPVSKIVIGKNNFKSRNATKNDIKSLMVWFDETYKNTIGPFIRDNELWQYYLNKISTQTEQILIIYEDELEIGYCFLNKNFVLEVGFNKLHQSQVFQFIMRKLRNDAYTDIVFKIGITHPLVRNIEKFEFSVFKRYVWRGGHIAKINNVSDFLRKFKPVLELRLLNAKVGEFELSCNKLLFVFNKNSLFVSEYDGENSEICFEKSEWVKLIFGVLPVQSLVGFSGEKNIGIVNILFPECNPQFPELDHF